MKQLLLLLIFVPLLIQNPTVDPLDRVADLLKGADTKELFKWLPSMVELTILDEGNVYSKVQAQVILNNFFDKNQPKSIKMIHRVNTNSNYRFAVMMLNTTTGNYRTSYSLKLIDGAFYLTELRIEIEKTK